MVTRAPRIASRSSSSGMAVISLDLAAQACCPSALTRGPGRDEVERVAVLGAIVGAPGCLAVDRHHLGTRVGARRRAAEACHPLREAGAKQLGIDRVHDVVQRVVTGDAARERQEAAQDVHVKHRPASDFHEVLRAGERAAQHRQQHFRQRIDHLPRLARVAQRGEMIEERRTHRRCHSGLHHPGDPLEAHSPPRHQTVQPCQSRSKAIALAHRLLQLHVGRKLSLCDSRVKKAGVFPAGPGSIGLRPTEPREAPSLGPFA